MTDSARISRREFLNAAALAAAGVMLPVTISHAQEGVEPGKPVPPILLESYPDQLTVEATRVYARELEKIGIRVKHQPVGFAQILGKVYGRKDYTAGMLGWGSSEDRVDPDFYLRTAFSTGGFFNAAHYSNPEYDRLVAAQRAQLDPAKRKELIAQCQRVYARDVPSWNVCGRAMINPINTRLFTNVKPSRAMGMETYQVHPYLELTPRTSLKEVNVATVFKMSSAHLLTERAGNGRGFLRFVFDPFLRYDRDLSLRPWAAESYKVIDPTTVDVKLRDGMTWHDGKPVTGDDARFTFEYLLKWRPAQLAALLDGVQGVELVNPSTVRVKLAAPSITFITVSLAQIPVLPRHIWQDVPDKYGVKNPDEWNMARHGPVGSGPFKLVSFKKDEDCYVQANPQHWTGRPKLDGIHYIQASSVEQLTGGMETDNIHVVADGLTLPEGKRLAQKPGIELFVTDSSTVINFWIDTRKPLFRDPAVRQAMYHATPKQKVLDIVLGGAGLVGRRSPIPPVYKEWIPADLPGDEFDVDRARKILADAGYSWDRDGVLVMKKM
jgi:peptide/nickel transport system substrate-binding protein